MGPSLYIYPLVGQFQLAELRRIVSSIPNVIEVEDLDHAFVFAGVESENRPQAISRVDYDDESHFLWRCPRVTISSAMVSLGVNWSDTSTGDLRAFCAALFSTFQCRAECSDGYEYQSNEKCWDWIENWLPEGK